MPKKNVESEQFKLYSIFERYGDSLDERYYERIELDDSTKISIANEYHSYLVEWSNLELLDFVASYTPNSKEVFCTDYSFPVHLTSLHKKGMTTEYKTFLPSNRPIGLIGIYSESAFKKKDEVYDYFFQVLDSRNVIAKKTLDRKRRTKLIGLLDSSFTTIDNDMFLLPKAMTCILHKGTHLLFHSYFQAAKILDLSQIFQEATDGDIRTIVKHSLFDSNDETIEIMCRANDQIKRKFSVIRDYEILEGKNATFSKIKKIAKKYGVEIEVNDEKEKIVFPNEIKKATAFLNLLNGSYFVHEITQKQCKTNSYRVLKKQTTE